MAGSPKQTALYRLAQQHDATFIEQTEAEIGVNPPRGLLAGTYVLAVSSGCDMVLLMLLATASVGAIANLRVVQCMKR